MNYGTHPRHVELRTRRTCNRTKVRKVLENDPQNTANGVQDLLTVHLGKFVH